jgi:hypothetical protein
MLCKHVGNCFLVNCPDGQPQKRVDGQLVRDVEQEAVDTECHHTRDKACAFVSIEKWMIAYQAKRDCGGKLENCRRGVLVR